MTLANHPEGQARSRTGTRSAILRLRAALRPLYRLSDTDEEGAVRQIVSQIEFTGGNLYALVLAIVVASVGLNVNSTAVIIGAMLISPLMGPIMGAGLGLGINDLVLVRRSVRNLSIAASASLVTSALYFLVSPLAEAQSELLARTRPTIYDVLIALAGGSAGIIAVTRRGDRGNVIPGVAIATALMPPLCTAGFGLATGNMAYFFGALYLFVINSVFICFATLAVVRLLGFRRVEALDPGEAGRRRLLLGVAMGLTILPSLYVGWQVVRETRFESAARRFVEESLVFSDRSVVSTKIIHGRDSSAIETTILGRPLPPETVDNLRQRLAAYGLDRARLVIHQPDEGTMAPEQLGQMVRSGILEDLYTRNEAALKSRDARIKLLEGELLRVRGAQLPLVDVARELAALYPDARSIQVGPAVQAGVGSAAGDTAQAAVIAWNRMPGGPERRRVDTFLSQRLNINPLRVTHTLVPRGR
jgi:uncharacterized hydrophobic protein (TIGR00271 family)